MLARLSEDGAVFPADVIVDWCDISEIAGAGRKCIQFSEKGSWEILVFSETTRWMRSLAATEGAPTMLVSGKPMHRIKNIDPMEDTRRKIAAIAPIRGRILDTATGLGYTAIEAAKTGKNIVTIEFDPAAIEIAKHNPWSRKLFDNPRIEQVIGDSFSVVDQFRDGEFAAIIHDPPTLSLAGELYSLEFYCKMFRILGANGRVFHYTGDPESGLGSSITQGVIRRLYEAGFRKVTRRPGAFGVVAYKGLPGREQRSRVGHPTRMRTKRVAYPVQSAEFARSNRRR